MKNNSENKYTSGKWSVNESDNEYHYEVISESANTLIAEMTDLTGEKLCPKAKANAEHICKCVNTHKDLITVLDLIVGSMALERVERFELLEMAKSALANATGTPATNFDYMAH